jgi:SAM-dependent methyltransferase
MAVDPRRFWDAKVLAWEQGRYGRPDQSPGLLEWIADRSSMSLRFRVAITPELLKPFLANKHVAELGCGSGILAGKLVEYGAASYLGIDIAEAAIMRARKRYGESDARIRFEVDSVAEMAPLAADLVISLGLFDWLKDDEIADVFHKSGPAHYLHAIAERRPGIQQLLHRSYVHLTYGQHTYRPRYLTCDHMKKLATAAVERPIYVYRDWRLSFGALISSFPIAEEIK